MTLVAPSAARLPPTAADEGRTPAGGQWAVAAALNWAFSFPATPRVLQVLAGVGLAMAVALALRRPVRAEANVGATSIWLLWWPLVPFLALIAGRLWCAACPFAGLTDLTERLVPWRRRGPGRRFRWAGALWLPVSIVLLGIAFLALGLEASGSMTVAVLGVFVVGSVGLALLFRGRAWCRYGCPLGAALGLYGALGGWVLRSRGLGAGNGGDAETQGRRDAGIGLSASLRPRVSVSEQPPAPSPRVRCPAYLNPRRAVDPQQCQICARCVQAKVASFAPQRPGVAAALGPADAALAVALVGVLAADTVRMTPAFLWYLGVALDLLGAASYRVAVALLPVIGTLLVAGLVGFAGARRVGGWRSAAAALVPLALATQLALSLQHLMGSGWPTIQGLLVELLPLPWEGHLPPTEAYSVIPALKGVQFALLGAAVALVLVRRGRLLPLPDRATALAATGGIVGLFALPMSLAC